MILYTQKKAKLETHRAKPSYRSFTSGQNDNRRAQDWKPTVSWTRIKRRGYRGRGCWRSGPFGCCRGLPGRSCKGILGAGFKTTEMKGIKREEKCRKRTKLNCKEGSLIQHELLETHFYGPCTVGGHKTMTLGAPSCWLHASGTALILLRPVRIQKVTRFSLYKGSEKHVLCIIRKEMDVKNKTQK